MKPITYGRPLALLLGAVLFIAAHANVTIKSVDNYAGNSNVYTDSPNTTVKVIELDADKKPVRSWTGTTDGEGKLTIPAGHNLSLPYLRAENADAKAAEFVLPSSVNANEPFLFTSTGTVEGEVVDIKTVEGEVVATQKADNLGRVFVPAGLAAGSYILTTARHGSAKVGQINVNSVKFDVADLKGILSFDDPYNALDATKLGTLNGSFQNLDALDLDDFVSTRSLNIYAATPRQIVFSRPSEAGMEPGPHQITLSNAKTGDKATANLLVYVATGKLTQTRVASGTQTQLVISVEPKELIGTAVAQITSGPVTFANGSGQMEVDIDSGRGVLAIQSQPGSAGTFDVNWWFKPGDHHKQPLKSHWWEPWKYKWWLWEPKKTDAPPKGGDTKTLPPKYEPFKEVDKDGKVVREGMTKTEEKDGKTVGHKVFTEPTKKDGTRVNGEETVTVEGDTRTTETDRTEFPLSGEKKDIHEVKVEKKDEKGEWQVESHEKTTKTSKGEDHEWIVKPKKKG